MSRQQASHDKNAVIIDCSEPKLDVKPLEATVAGKQYIIKHYDIEKPFACAAITEHPLTHAKTYEVIEPTITEEERKQLQKITEFLVDTLDVTMRDFDSRSKAIAYLEEKVRIIVKKFHLKIDEQRLNKMLYYIIRDFVGFSKIDVMMKDPLIEDISCNGENLPLYIWHRIYESVPTNVSFSSDEELDSFIIKLAYRAGKMISIANPLLDASLPDGSRIQMSYGKQVTRQGSTFTIRKFKAEPLTIVDLIKLNTLSSEMAALFWFLVEKKCSVFVCGGIASGKTTMLNCLSSFISPDSKIVTIEDTPEIQVYHKNWIRSVTRPTMKVDSDITMFDLLKSAVRQRPDYIIVGEIRGEEAYTLFQAMATGHLGMATLHAESAASALNRLETKPMDIPRRLVAGLNIVTIQERIEREDGPARRTTSVTEVVGIDSKSGEVKTNEIFRWDAKTDSYKRTKESYYLGKAASKSFYSLKEIKKDIETRKRILDWMVSRGMTSFKEVTDSIRNFEYMRNDFCTFIEDGKKR